MALLSAKNIRKSYKIGINEKQEVLRGVNVEFKSGDLVALLGESGCGKSTLINILGGLDNDYTGSVVLKDEYIRDYSETQMDDYRKKRVGLIFQSYELIPNLNLKGNIEIAMTISGIDAQTRSERADDLLKLVGLYDFREKMPNQLSGGQKQRIAIARSLANNPTIILADEPTGALDAESADLVMDILTRVAKSGKLVLMVTHSEKVAAQCARVLTMEKGKIVSDVENFKLNVDSARDRHITPKPFKIKEIFAIASGNIKQTKQRCLMISFGMGIAMAVVLLILCLSGGLTNYISDLQEEQGATTLMAYSLSSSSSNATFSNISSDDIESIEELSGVEEVVVSYARTSVDYIYDDSYQDNYQDSKFDYIFEVVSNTASFDILYGSDLTAGSSSMQIIVNESLATTLANGSGLVSCVGQTITIDDDNTVEFTIVGIFEDTTDLSSSGVAYVIESGMDALYGTAETLYKKILTITLEDITHLTNISMALQYYDLDSFQSENTAEDVLDYLDIATGVLVGVSAISLLVSALMIFIVLTISTEERKREIGIMRSVGAKKGDIVKLFIFESICMGLIGGAFALGAALILSSMMNIICYIMLEAIFLSYNVIYYLVCFALTVIISIIAGIAPAYKASYLDPVECIRGE